jgi:hypothetical protein
MTSLPRAAASMLLAKVGSTPVLVPHRLDLGRPAASATTGADQEAAPHRHWENLIEARTTSPPTGGRPATGRLLGRRWAGADQRRLSRAIQLTSTDPQGALVGPGKEDRLLVALLWQAYTGGDVRFHPDLSPRRRQQRRCQPPASTASTWNGSSSRLTRCCTT